MSSDEARSERPLDAIHKEKSKKVWDMVYSDRQIQVEERGAEGVIMLDFLPKRSTNTGVYYANLLDQLRIAIRKKTLR